MACQLLNGQATLLRVIVGGGICPRFRADLFLTIRHDRHRQRFPDELAAELMVLTQAL
jgi:hypothetical protein